MKSKTRALVLISGGLDSRLAVKLLQEQGIEVIGINFEFPFGSGCCNPLCTFSFSQKNEFKLEIISCKKGKLFKEYMGIVKNPKFDHGCGMNPCIDCRIFILKKAKALMKKYKADFIATGEVLNERPMSQHLEALKLTEEETGLKGKLLRPLSAKLLPETDAEKEGLVDRSRLLGIKGRARNIQIELANKFKITYPTPGGGCLLCEKEFVKKLQDALQHKEVEENKDLDRLKTGRHFRFDGAKIIIGRNHGENLMLEKLGKNWVKLEAKDVVGPITIIQKDKPSPLKKAAELTAFYADSEGKKTKVIFWKKFRKDAGEIEVEIPSREMVEDVRIK
ncbi:MAG: hypothetical protein KKE23_01240 [Nanoarchaeota archaeon]|nr:hypothetical protein [Nanoarchaeota archaeon]